ncbi:hypothetical protein HYQ46_002184 [Verticillium longisporum]|nr:hypothetical protein HYQ44_016978 [Verticillium longisporum]KAG7152971.1 hypothetical protein HYQ46_002184 [Verticillium longisporum]
MRVDLVIVERSVSPLSSEDGEETQLWPRPLALPPSRSSQKLRGCSEATRDAKIERLRNENNNLKQEIHVLRNKQRSDHGRLEVLREQGGYQRQVLREQTREIAEAISVVEEVFLEYEAWVRRSMGSRSSTSRMDLLSY